MKTLQQIGVDIGALVETKNLAYGDSFRVSGEAMRLLYPNGVAPEQLGDALLLVRIWDKMKRIATDRDALGESPFQDIAGYGILGVHLHQHTKENVGPCLDNASAPDAPLSPKAQPASAPQPTNATTTTNANATTAPAPSPLPASSSSPSAAASAPPAPATANRSEDEKRKDERSCHLPQTYDGWVYRDNIARCAYCGEDPSGLPIRVYAQIKGPRGLYLVRVCSYYCGERIVDLAEDHAQAGTRP